jgi:hypothetical protein
MAGKNTIVVIEKLNFFTFLFFLAFLTKQFKTANYVHTSRFFDFIFPKIRMISKRTSERFIRINFNDFLGSYCDIKKETGLYVNDALFDRYRSNIYSTLTLNFCGNSDFSLAIKKELYNRYTQKRVKTFVFLKKLSVFHEQIIFLPTDCEDIKGLLSRKNRLNAILSIPQTYMISLQTADILKTIGIMALYPFLIVILAGTILLKGVSFRSAPKKTFTYGIDTYHYGIDWKRPYHEFFIYNDDDFHHSRILHVFRSPLRDTKTKIKFERYHFPCTTWDKQKVPVKYFISRVLWDLILKQLKEYLFSIPYTNKKPFFLLPSIATIKMTIESEIFYIGYDVKVFVSRDEYSPLHIVRTLVANRNNNFSVGFMHGDYTIPGIETSVYLFYDKYGIYGPFYEKLNNPGFVSCRTEIIGAGIYGLDKTYTLAQGNYVPRSYAEIKKTYRIILIIGTSSGNDIDTCFTKKLLIKFYTDILDLTDEFKDYYRIIKPAGDELSDKQLADVKEGHERVIIDTDLWIYKLILVADLTVVIGSTTVGLESIMAGKKVLYYDVYHYPEHAYAEYAPFLVSRNFEELTKNINYVLKENRYLDNTTLELLKYKHGFRFDGRVTERFRQMCRSLVSQQKF